MTQTKPQILVVGAAILEGNRCWAARRAAHVHSAGLWEFPGGKVETGEDPEAALEREILEEMNLSVQVGSWIGRGTVDQDTRIIVLDVYRCRLDAPLNVDDLRLTDHDALRCLSIDELGSVTWADADIPILDPLAQLLRSLPST